MRAFFVRSARSPSSRHCCWRSAAHRARDAGGAPGSGVPRARKHQRARTTIDPAQGLESRTILGGHLPRRAIWRRLLRTKWVEMDGLYPTFATALRATGVKVERLCDGVDSTACSYPTPS